MDLRLFAQRKCHSDIRYEKLTFFPPAQVRPQRVVRTSVCSAAARRSDCETPLRELPAVEGGGFIRISVMDPRVRVDAEASFPTSLFF